MGPPSEPLSRKRARTSSSHSSPRESYSRAGPSLCQLLFFSLPQASTSDQILTHPQASGSGQDHTQPPTSPEDIGATFTQILRDFELIDGHLLVPRDTREPVAILNRVKEALDYDLQKISNAKTGPARGLRPLDTEDEPILHLTPVSHPQIPTAAFVSLRKPLLDALLKRCPALRIRNLTLCPGVMLSVMVSIFTHPDPDTEGDPTKADLVRAMESLVGFIPAYRTVSTNSINEKNTFSESLARSFGSFSWVELYQPVLIEAWESVQPSNGEQCWRLARLFNAGSWLGVFRSEFRPGLGLTDVYNNYLGRQSQLLHRYTQQQGAPNQGLSTTVQPFCSSFMLHSTSARFGEICREPGGVEFVENYCQTELEALERGDFAGTLGLLSGSISEVMSISAAAVRIADDKFDREAFINDGVTAIRVSSIDWATEIALHCGVLYPNIYKRAVQVHLNAGMAVADDLRRSKKPSKDIDNYWTSIRKERKLKGPPTALFYVLNGIVPNQDLTQPQYQNLNSWPGSTIDTMPPLIQDCLNDLVTQADVRNRLIHFGRNVRSLRAGGEGGKASMDRKGEARRQNGRRSIAEPAAGATVDGTTTVSASKVASSDGEPLSDRAASGCHSDCPCLPSPTSVPHGLTAASNELLRYPDGLSNGSSLFSNIHVDSTASSEFQPNNTSPPSRLLSTTTTEPNRSTAPHKTTTSPYDHRSLIILTGLKTLFRKQLPKMPREYIARPVYDENSRSLAIIVKRGYRVVEGSAFNPSHNETWQKLYSSPDSADQERGYGGMLIDHFKAHIRRTYPNMHHSLTYADNFAVGYLERREFSKEITLNKSVWAGYIKEYEGGTIMQRMSTDGLRETGWNPEMEKEYVMISLNLKSPDYNSMEKTLNNLKKRSLSWLFRQPVNLGEVPDYPYHTQNPMGVSMHMEPKPESNQCKNIKQFVHGAPLIFGMPTAKPEDDYVRKKYAENGEIPSPHISSGLRCNVSSDSRSPDDVYCQWAIAFPVPVNTFSMATRYGAAGHIVKTYFLLPLSIRAGRAATVTTVLRSWEEEIGTYLAEISPALIASFCSVTAVLFKFLSKQCSMDGLKDEEWYQKCACGKRFYQPNSYTHHIQGCSSHKRDVGASLEGARARWAAKAAKPKKGKEAIASWYGDKDLDVDHDISRPEAGPSLLEAPRAETPVPEFLGRGSRAIEPVKRYRADFVATSTMLFHFVPDPPPPESPSASGEASSPQEKSGDLDTELENPKPPARNQTTVARSPYHPFPNLSAFLLGQWFWSDQGKSRESFRQLVDIITSEVFEPRDLLLANWNSIQDVLASSEFEDTGSGTMWVEDGQSWQTTSVIVDVPFNSTSTKPGSQSFTVEGFRYRPLTSVIRAKLLDFGHTDNFHFVPYDLRWRPSGSESDCRVYGELYHSQAFLDAYKEIQCLPPEPEEDHLPRYVVGLMFSSDQTMLASFGDAKLWPLYMQFGNESKNRRARVSLGLFEEIAYFRTLPDEFSDWYIDLSGKKTVGRTVATHVHRELFHAQWRSLLDDDFIHAYRHGLVVDCFDAVRRRFYPRIMTYSADYPERTVVVSIRTLGQAPCCKCLVSLDEIAAMGQPGDREIRTSRRRVDSAERQTKIDRARSMIYQRKHLSVNSKPVEAILQPTSLVPTQNAFSERLLPHGFNVFDMAAVDILHEVEIGVWKSLFLHLLRLLEVVDPALINVLDRRYRQVPTFGRDTIRRFSKSVSLLKQLAAWNYEDMLQCAGPVFEGLFPGDHGVRVENLLFTLGHWHALAKLRMHTEFTLELLDQWTSFLGEEQEYLEYEARKRAQARRSGKASSSRRGAAAASVPLAEHTAAEITPSDGPGLAESATSSAKPRAKKLGRSKKQHPSVSHEATEHDSALPVADDDGRQPRTWNINTPKFHALGDVVAFIRRFGTTDSYSTQLSEHFHRVSKARYKKTNKKDIHHQLSRLQARQARLKRLKNQIDPPEDEMTGDVDDAPRAPGSQWYFIGKSQNYPVIMTHFIRTHEGDWAVKGFLPRLKSHLYPRLIDELLREARMNSELYGQSIPTLLALSNSFRAEDVKNLHFHSDRIYRHSVFKIRFTTYDCRVGEDTFNPSTSRRDFMCLRRPVGEGPSSRASENDSQYRYGRILGVYHVNVLYSGPGALDTRKRRFDFLWVRWFVPVEASRPWSDKRHDVVSLARSTTPGASGFLDPLEVLRAAHIVPRFTAGPVYDLQDDTDRRAPLLSKCAQDRSDWKEYVVNRFVDRDMTMRFHPGLTPGHVSTTSFAQAPIEATQMEWEADCLQPQAEALVDAEMADEVATDSDDSEYDPLPLFDRHPGEELGEEEEEELLSDVPDPDSDVENADVYPSKVMDDFQGWTLLEERAFPFGGPPHWRFIALVYLEATIRRDLIDFEIAIFRGIRFSAFHVTRQPELFVTWVAEYDHLRKKHHHHCSPRYSFRAASATPRSCGLSGKDLGPLKFGMANTSGLSVRLLQSFGDLPETRLLQSFINTTPSVLFKAPHRLGTSKADDDGYCRRILDIRKAMTVTAHYQCRFDQSPTWNAASNVTLRVRPEQSCAPGAPRLSVNPDMAREIPTAPTTPVISPFILNTTPSVVALPRPLRRASPPPIPLHLYPDPGVSSSGRAGVVGPVGRPFPTSQICYC
ncbi:hypothetical protein NMY22_g8628 [Coprinellus aureogranulatus]|nr:hypothetical protein NMY22_g8628 [Coprinellus aureogranulatus]